ncbi:hypothetical protein [Pyxidicoccus xibeiensis]|uniref:hypothetical protein n=1 Tax=Pyxidicoccus xibeiensis TaxID=2906759 RepID=UPI0020A6E467|nr:hypothetical protein [Pyxidicoccus xibeiensis]MCP3142353.1 hypothetical protein [Pyxidicoccus xibeiensis]
MKMMRSPMSMFSLSLCLGLAAPALAQEEAAPAAAQQTPTPEASEASPAVPASAAPIAPPLAPSLRLYFANVDFLRANPIGIESQNRLILQKRLSDSENMLFRDNFLSGALALKLNPASMKVGPEVTFQPIAMLNVKGTFEYVQYFGAFGYLQSYPGPLGDFSDDARDLTKDNAYSTSGTHFMLEPTVQAKVKSFVVRSKTSIERWNVDLNEGDQATFYDAFLDTLVPGKGWVFTNDSDLLMLASPQLTFGARFSAVFPQYEDLAEGVTKPDNSHMRIGPMAAYAFSTDEGGSFNRPTLFVNVAWYLKHPNREGAMPYVAAGFSFTSDIMNME